MIVALCLVAVGLVAEVLTVVDPIAHVHLPIASNGAAVLLPVSTLQLTFYFISIVSSERYKNVSLDSKL